MLYYSCSSLSKLRSEQEIYMNMNKNKHLILDERYVIEHSLNENMSFKAIGKQILKDCTTVSKEVKSHIVFEKKGAPYKPFNDCLNRRHCSHHGDVCISCERHKSRNKCSICGHCTTSCVDYSKEVLWSSFFVTL
ncbi:MAG: helix-turn-helix domain-containing protein [Butyribacter sp.]|uniref:helix-turn-helix domain-containing protein n=1 Tax=Butyribacter sp. TaxID=2822465 RepID=UPI00399C512F